MIDFKKYNFDDTCIDFFLKIEDYCINGQSDIVLEYKGHSILLEPSGKEVSVYAYDKLLGRYENFDELFLKHKIADKRLIEVVKDLEIGE